MTTSHQFRDRGVALWRWGRRQRSGCAPFNILSCGIGLPIAEIAGDVNGLRLGTPEIVRFGMKPEHMPELAGFIADGLSGARPDEAIARDVTAFRRKFGRLHYVRVTSGRRHSRAERSADPRIS
jgi:glycine hydroxymethyltransferase